MKTGREGHLRSGTTNSSRLSCRSVTKSEVMTLTVDKGWVTEASVEDVKLPPGVHRTMFRLQGGDWVAREIVQGRSMPAAPSSWSAAVMSYGGEIRGLP